MNAPTPKVSAIIIFLNEARFLADAIESVLAQTSPDWELLLVDDGSSDGSSDIARGYAVRHSARIRYLAHEGHANQGMSASRNLGLDHARGRYVGFLDADDLWTARKLEEQTAVLDSHPRVGMVYGRTLLWHSWRGDSGAVDEYCPLGVDPSTVVEPPALLLSLIDNRWQTPTTCNALLRRDVIDKVGRFEPRFRGMFEDQVFFMKVALEVPTFVADATWARYRQRPDSCSAKAEASGRMRDMRLRLLEWLEDYLRGRGLTRGPVWRALKRQQRVARWSMLGRWLIRWRRLTERRSPHAYR